MFQLWRQQPFAPGLTLVRETSLVVGGKVAIFFGAGQTVSQPATDDPPTLYNVNIPWPPQPQSARNPKPPAAERS
jgi:hypothetical protein